MLKSQISNKKLRDFGLLVGFIFPILIGWIIPSLSGHIFRIWTLWIGLPLLILSFLSPRLLFYPYKIWMKIGYFLGWINSRIILGILFLLILLPIALIMKIFNYDPLKLKKSSNKTYKENKKNYKIDLNRIF